MLPSSILRQVFSHNTLPPLRFHLPGHALVHCNSCEDTAYLDIWIKKWSVLDFCKPLSIENLITCYCQGDWETTHLDKLIEKFIQCPEFLSKYIPHRYPILMQNILSKYKQSIAKPTTIQTLFLDPDFCSYWLDESMSHCSAWFSSQEESFHVAKHRNYTRILQQIDSECSESILDANPQWGSFADFAVAKNMHLSLLCQYASQVDYVHQRLKLSHAVGDYSIFLRNPPKKTHFDAIVSLEHLIHLPSSQWQTYLAKLHSLLRPQGKLLLQTFMRQGKWPDSISSLFFSGGFIPAEGDLITLFHNNGFSLQNTFSMASSYEKTLSYWISRIESQQTYLTSHGYSEFDVRSFILLFSLLKAGLQTKYIGAYQFTLTKP